VRAARVGRARRSVRVPEPTVVYKPRQLALRVRGRDVVLTKVQNRLERDSGRETTTTGGGKARALAEGGDAGVLQAPGLHRSTRGAPVKGMGRSARLEGHRWPAIARRRLTGGDGSGTNPASSRARGRLG
jgi:hypothetical protein